ncbi:MAG: nuclease-related domain-containing protein [Acidimicrobiales bacterium]
MSDIQRADADGGGEPRVAWNDLTANKPGAEARARALEIKQRAPIRVFLGRVLGVHNNERAWRVGADGEEEVARRLDKLPDGWCVLHAIPVGEKGSDIDHVIIGPGGVFTLNTKNHSNGKVWVGQKSFLVNGQKTDYLRNSRHEAKRATKLLSAACAFNVNVAPIIVVMASSMTVKAKPEGVEVVARKQIVKWLSSRPAVLTPDAVDRIFHHARRDLTWRPPGGGPR